MYGLWGLAKKTERVIDVNFGNIQTITDTIEKPAMEQTWSSIIQGNIFFLIGYKHCCPEY